MKRDLNKLREQMTSARKILENCEVCARRCQVNRLKGELGFCKLADEIIVSSASPHFGEESPLVGTHGSGTIFLSSCNLGCIYCQNWDISHQRIGKRISTGECADIMLKLQKTGCHNINFVTPSHVTPQLTEALLDAWDRGLEIPIVYNCGGYESLDMIKLLEGFIDIYMPDVKYSDSAIAQELSDAPNYFENLKPVIKEMHRQVGDLKTDPGNIALSGLLVRHLVLPYGLAGTEEIVSFLADEISKDTYINLMDQYYPCSEGVSHSKLGRMLKPQEHQKAIELAKRAGLHNFL